MRALAMGVWLLSIAVHAEQWADETEQPAPVAAPQPWLGPIGGVQIGVAHWVDSGPNLGVKLGVRARVARHLVLGVQSSWEFGPTTLLNTPCPTFSQGCEQPAVLVHVINVLAVVELFTVSAFETVLAPELSVSLVGGAIMGLAPQPELLAEAGVQFQMLRLRPSGWWFPVYVQVLLPLVLGSVPRFAVGVGL